MKNKKRIISKYLTPVFESSDSSAEWFGYYNYDTLNYDNSKMLCNRAKSESPIIAKGDFVDLGYYDLLNGTWHKIGESDSWNWQQGAMMQWLPGPGNEMKVIYNCSRNGRLASRIHDISTGEDKDIDWPIYGITPDGKKSISLDLERSYWCRAYHYQSVVNLEKKGRIVDGDGVFEIDLVNNTRRLLLDINDVVALEPDEGFDRMKHWIEHIMINPAGSKFCFLHRYSPVTDDLSYRTRICIANIDGSGLQVIPGWNTFMWSHFGWGKADDFTIYTYKRPSLYRKFDISADQVVGRKDLNLSMKARARTLALRVRRAIPKRILKMITTRSSFYQHYIIGDDGSYRLNDIWGSSLFDVDGHPTFSTDGRYLLTDSYPDQNNDRRYIVYNIQSQKGIVIARMPENSLPGNEACDLHPKLSRDNQYVVFDTTSSGKHSMMLFKLNWDLIEKDL